MTESASPAEEYLNALERVCSIAYPLSPLSHGVWGRTDIARLADRIFARMLVTASSLVRLCRCDQPVGSLPAWVDLTAQANLARSILEAYEALDYLVLEHVGREEAEFRSWLYSLHQETERQKIYHALGIHDSENPFGGWQFIADLAVMELKKNPYFRRLTPRLQTHLLNGRRAFYRQTPAASTKRVNGAERDGIYKLLSNFVHSHPLAIQMQSKSRLWREFNGRDVSVISVYAASRYLSLGLDGLIRVRRLGRQIPRADRTFVRKQMALSLPAMPVP